MYACYNSFYDCKNMVDVQSQSSGPYSVVTQS